MEKLSIREIKGIVIKQILFSFISFSLTCYACVYVCASVCIWEKEKREEGENENVYTSAYLNTQKWARVKKMTLP